MPRPFRRYEPQQGFVLPPSPQEWLPESHPAYFIPDLVDETDLSRIEKYEAERGQPPYDPGMMIRLLIYACAVRVRSSRRIKQKGDVAYRVPVGNPHADRDTIATFRKGHRGEFQESFVQALKPCEEAGPGKPGEVASDGTKVKANASRHKAMSYERMREREKELQAQVQKRMEEAEHQDEQEDRRYGKGRSGREIPEE